uniref:Ribosomal protein L6 n=1 Tax=Crouania attenuata TaxID=42002 RepID=A0A4D6WPQ3_9FLOR|nr:ribosomal protein L6 [Crouania attenuata]
MSRIGKQNIILPPKTTADIQQSVVYINGPKGQLSFKLSNLINVEYINNIITLTKKNNTKKAQELHGLSRSIINNMVIGVSQGFEKKLIIHGVGYRSQIQDKKLILNVGYSHSVTIIPPEHIEIKVEQSINIIIRGINKETVGQIAAQIRSVRPPEPYKGKGIRYANEHVRRKVGKAGK